MKVAFLDIDGVLNSTRTNVAFGGYPMDFTPEAMEQFDHVAIGLIRGIVRAADASVVLSSSWRLTHDWNDVATALDLPIMGRTPSLCGPRGAEIAAWLADHPEVEQYAIVDDSADMLDSQRPHFVRTDLHEGFMWRDAVKLAELLGVDPYDGHPGRIRMPGKTLEWEE
jgi:hypothetical protein